jgi:hypothetical protein
VTNGRPSETGGTGDTGADEDVGENVGGNVRELDGF